MSAETLAKADAFLSTEAQSGKAESNRTWLKRKSGADSLNALTIRQPWAWLIVSGKKDIENRSWRTNYRGKFLVHAAMAFSKTPLEDIEAQFRVKLPPREQMLRGGIIGSCELVDCITAHRSKWFEGPFGFVLTNARPRRFERVGGRLGFWNYSRRTDKR